MGIFLNPQDVPSAKLAEFFCTIDGRRYSMLNAKNFEATASVSNADVPRLGAMITGKKANGLEIKLKFTVYKCSPMFDNLIETYKKGLQNQNIFPVVIQEFPMIDISLEEQQRIVDEIHSEISKQEKIKSQISGLRSKIDEIVEKTIISGN